MVKSIKAIIIAVVLVSMTMILLSSCGSNNPLSASPVAAPKPANTDPSAFSSFAPGPKLTPLPDWMMNLPPASISCLLAEPHLNLNATSPNKKPFNQLCGDYYYRVLYERGAIATAADTQSGTCGVLGCSAAEKWGIYEIGGQGGTVARLVFLGLIFQCYDPCKAGLVTTYPPNPNQQAKYLYTIRCDDPCFLGGNFPLDAFTGSGAPNVPYIGGDGRIYGTAGGPPPPPPPASEARKLLGVMITPNTASISVGETTSFTGTAIYSKPPVTEPVTNAIKSQNPNAATIVNGTLTGINEGHTDLTVTAGAFTAWSYVDVALGVPNSVVIEPASASMLIGDKYTFKAFAVYPGNKRVDVSSRYETTWSSDTAIATIAGGVVTGVASGSTPISATFKGMTGTATVNVIDIPPVPDSVQITPLNASIAQGESQQFIATAIYNSLPQYKPDVTNDPNTTWTAGNTGVAALNAASKGSATGIAPGRSYIWCDYKGVQSTTAAMLEVSEPKIFVDVSYTIFAWPGQIRAWDRYTLKTIVSYSDKSIPPVDATTLASYKIDKPGVFTSINGIFSYPDVGWELWADAASGSATITATVTTTSGRTASNSVLLTINVNGNNPPPGGQCRNYVQYSMNDYPTTAYDTYFYPNGVTSHTIGTNSVGTAQNPPIYGKGCAVTAYAMVLATLGQKINGQLVDPVNLNQWLIDNGGYSSGGYIDPAIISAFPGAPSTRLSTTDKITYLDSAINNCKPIIAGVTTPLGNSHFVVVIDKKGDDYVIIDPYSYRTTSLKNYYGNNINQVITF